MSSDTDLRTDRLLAGARRLIADLAALPLVVNQIFPLHDRSISIVGCNVTVLLRVEEHWLRLVDKGDVPLPLRGATAIAAAQAALAATASTNSANAADDTKPAQLTHQQSEVLAKRRGTDIDMAVLQKARSAAFGSAKVDPTSPRRGNVQVGEARRGTYIDGIGQGSRNRDNRGAARARAASLRRGSMDSDEETEVPPPPDDDMTVANWDDDDESHEDSDRANGTSVSPPVQIELAQSGGLQLPTRPPAAAAPAVSSSPSSAPTPGGGPPPVAARPASLNTSSAPSSTPSSPMVRSPSNASSVAATASGGPNSQRQQAAPSPTPASQPTPASAMPAPAVAARQPPPSAATTLQSSPAPVLAVAAVAPAPVAVAAPQPVVAAGAAGAAVVAPAQAAASTPAPSVPSRSLSPSRVPSQPAPAPPAAANGAGVASRAQPAARAAVAARSPAPPLSIVGSPAARTPIPVPQRAARPAARAAAVNPLARSQPITLPARPQAPTRAVQPAARVAVMPGMAPLAGPPPPVPQKTPSLPGGVMHPAGLLLAAPKPAVRQRSLAIEHLSDSDDDGPPPRPPSADSDGTGNSPRTVPPAVDASKVAPVPWAAVAAAQAVDAAKPSSAYQQLPKAPQQKNEYEDCQSVLGEPPAAAAAVQYEKLPADQPAPAAIQYLELPLPTAVVKAPVQSEYIDVQLIAQHHADSLQYGALPAEPPVSSGGEGYQELPHIPPQSAINPQYERLPQRDAANIDNDAAAAAAEAAGAAAAAAAAGANGPVASGPGAEYAELSLVTARKVEPDVPKQPVQSSSPRVGLPVSAPTRGLVARGSGTPVARGPPAARRGPRVAPARGSGRPVAFMPSRRGPAVVLRHSPPVPLDADDDDDVLGMIESGAQNAVLEWTDLERTAAGDMIASVEELDE